MCRKSSAVWSSKKKEEEIAFARNNDTFPCLQIFIYAAMFFLENPWELSYESWTVWPKYWLSPIDIIMMRSYSSFTTTLIQACWHFITFTHLKRNFKDPGFTTVSDRIWVTVLLSVPIATSRAISALIGPLSENLGPLSVYILTV